MIEIIRPGQLKYETTCSKCNCFFRFQAEDVTRKTMWDDHGGHYPVCDFYEIECPTCGHIVDVGDNKNLLKEKDKMKHVDR